MSNYTRWYKEGTIAVTKGSATVTGTSTYWGTAGLNPGDIVKIDGVDYELASVTDNTHLTLATNYAGSTASGLTYSIVRNFTATSGANVAASASKLLGDFERYINTDMQKINGKSAYEVAVANGYTGTQAQWLESLKAAGEWTSAKTRLTDLESRATAIEAVNTSQASSISSINARTLGIVNGGQSGNCTMHNTIWRGKSLGKFTAAHSAAIRNGTFTDMYLGDFFADAAGVWNAYQIIGFDCFYGPGLTNNAHHIVLRRNEKFDSTFNSTNSTTGGYLNSTWRTETKPALEEQFAADFIDSSHLWHHTDYLSSACSGGKVTGCTTVTDSCVELFDERQVTGARYSHTCEKDAVGVTTAFTQQFPAYAFFENFGWLNGACLTRTIISDTQLRYIYNYHAAWGVNANSSAFTTVYLTVN